MTKEEFDELMTLENRDLIIAILLRGVNFKDGY